MYVAVKIWDLLAKLAYLTYRCVSGILHHPSYKVKTQIIS